MRDTFALGGGPYHFFARSSRSAAASSICSARSFFSLAFSSSSCFRRLASETSMPPYLAFQLYSVASETPCLRARSAVFAPASCSRSTPIICSSVNLARFICPSFTRPDSNSAWRKFAVEGQATSTIGIEENCDDPLRKQAEAQFWQLYWGVLPMVADDQVGLAADLFSEALDHP